MQVLSDWNVGSRQCRAKEMSSHGNIESIEHSEINLLCNIGCLKTRSDLECSRPALKKHVFGRTPKAKQTPLTTFPFCRFCL